MADYEGVIIGESLRERTFLDKFKILKTSIEKLEASEGEWHFCYVTVPEGLIESLTEEAKGVIRDGWYMHFWRGDKMFVIFPGQKFILFKHDSESIERARAHGISMGIPRDELLFENLFID